MSLSELFDRTVRQTGPENRDLENYKLQVEFERMIREEPGIKFPMISNCNPRTKYSAMDV